MFRKKVVPEDRNVQMVVIDPGKHTTKAMTLKSDICHFRTKMHDNAQEVDARGNTYDVVYDGKQYLIGEQAEEQSYDVTKTNLLHKLVTYTAITRLADDNSIIRLIINCPVSIYKNKQQRDEYKDYIYNSGQFKITVDGDDFSYEIENVLVLPEDYGAVHMYPYLFTGKRVALIGLGGLNMNFMIINDLVPEIHSMFTINHGGNELESNIVNELNSRYALNIDPKDAPYILKNKGIKVRGSIDKNSTRIVDDVIEGFVKNIIQEIKRNGHNLDMLDVVFVGGTSEAIQSYIERVIDHVAVAKEAQWAAVEGSLKIGVEVWKRKDEAER